MSDKAQYKTDDGEIIEVTAEEAFEAGTFLELPDGRLARRVNRPSMKKKSLSGAVGQAPIISDAMGFTDNQFAEMEADRQLHGFHDIEFKQDPLEPRFFQVHCGSEKAKRRYMEHRGFTDRNNSNGSAAMSSPEHFDKAREIIEREHSSD